MRLFRYFIFVLFFVLSIIACSSNDDHQDTPPAPAIKFPHPPKFGVERPSQPRYILLPHIADFPWVANMYNCNGGFIRDCYGISYNGGLVMSAPINVYIIWYGDWSSNLDAKRIVEEFISNIGTSDYWQINQMYCDVSRQCVSNIVQLAGVLNEPAYIAQSILNDDHIKTIAKDALQNKKLPIDPNGMYLIIPSKDIDIASSCSFFCGWHDADVFNGTKIKVSFIQDVSKCADVCSAFGQGMSYGFKVPNNNIAGDGMVNIIAHEMSEMATDPLPSLDPNGGSAWADGFYENADRCAWQFLKMYKTATGADANIKLSSGEYLVQGNWVLKDQGYCSIDTGANPANQ